ncbi:MAG: sulfatase-like hydrolase/transferase, partial [archaeon]|nr:sulfatase-like hydrolase/transferase [archaeon]
MFCIFDTMRKDAIGAYGGPSSTPNLDSLSKDAVLYKNCITPAPWTFPSHVSFFTGEYASQHGLHETYEIKGRELWHRKDIVGPQSITEALKKSGYNTVGMSANPWLHPGTIFAKGFNFFTCDSKEERVSASEREAVKRASQYGKTPREIALHLISRGRIRELFELYSAYRTIKSKQKQNNYPLIKGGDKIARILRESIFEEPFFLFINFMEMHDPYTSYELG